LQSLSDPSLADKTMSVNETFKFEIVGGYDTYTWRWNGKVIPEATGASYTLTTNSKPAGIYELSIVATGDHYFSFRLYRGGEPEPCGVVSEVVGVGGNLSSDKTYTLDLEDLDLLYNLVWESNGGDEYIEWPHNLTEDITIHAQWEHPVIFHPLGGSTTPPTQYVPLGETASDPGSIIKEAGGMYLGPINDVASLTVTFEGWYDNPAYSNLEYNFNTAGGGGVFVAAGSFNKTGNSVIYGDTNTTFGDDDTNNNTATGGATNGHAVYYYNGSKYRNKTLGSGENIRTSSATGWN
jgi:hypothetical protein